MQDLNQPPAKLTVNLLHSLALSAALLFIGTCAHAQTQPAPSPTPQAAPTPTLEQQFFKNILHDQRAIWTAPFPRYAPPLIRSASFGYALSSMIGAGLVILVCMLASWFSRASR